MTDTAATGAVRTGTAATGIAVAAALGVALSGCTVSVNSASVNSASDHTASANTSQANTDPTNTDPTNTDPLAVVATTTQLTDFAAEVGGDDIELMGLLPAGSAHHFDPTPADLLALSQADVLIVNGLGLEPFIDSAVDASGFAGTIITASDGVDIDGVDSDGVDADGAGHAHEGDHGSDDHSDDEHGDDGHNHDQHSHDGHSHDGHSHGAVNPHIWTSPTNARGMVDEIREGLAAADPTHAAAYDRRAAAYDERLETLDVWVGEHIAKVPASDRVLVSGHDSLHYYLDDYDITFAGAILPSFEDNAEPSAADIDDLVATIRAKNVRAIFVESSMNPKLARTIAKESGACVVDEDALYVDSLGPAGSGADTYIGATEHNTRVILDAWGEGRP